MLPVFHGKKSQNVDACGEENRCVKANKRLFKPCGAALTIKIMITLVCLVNFRFSCVNAVKHRILYFDVRDSCGPS